ncbi:MULTISPECIES: Asp23/Gls24 family envelope stress response protein [Enterococcus]|uniref:Asp23/Gls24 family envelope stress response protein n=1 Tax=Enterococcus TaxID=1350 RepID=UPI00116432F8|nr:Asp23/Gls24 family envelope stress response protein [Enterococcus avium]HAP3021837.1 Asp23/Gls24 family envelope stress response protein [Enterococcus faecalis]AYQ24128.1 Asp23/Gls24 family envelope stress response protein [Enterococcus avium]HBI1562669.1 Asp23/Gls24 family envelope stress response protein [Enterococcus faecalis]HBI1565809.1 Asp23/Gls24 family envelope stress response protein [Enterococcus faecalis]HBI1718081.1 Asp23/Gls24 family envelope stress response protein [Enterococc
MEKTKENVKEETKKANVQGKLTYEDKVIQKIIGISLERVEGLLTVDGGFFSNLAGKLVNTEDIASGVEVEVGEKQVAVDLDIVAEYGKDIRKIYNEMKEIITKEVQSMTGLEVIEVNVNVVDIKTEKQYEEDSVSLQDKVGEATESVSNFASEQTEKAKELASKGSSKAKELTYSRVK